MHPLNKIAKSCTGRIIFHRVNEKAEQHKELIRIAISFSLKYFSELNCL
jgi:hypothetical protein